jgi:4-amino-4-deoxy-L-arabinose transferase-like glycosyltransferase
MHPTAASSFNDLSAMSHRANLDGTRMMRAATSFALKQTDRRRLPADTESRMIDQAERIDLPRDPVRVRWAVYGGLAVLALTLRLACASGLVGSDDLFYATYAKAMAEGQYAEILSQLRGIEHVHYALRYGVLLPLAAVYRVFGVSEWTTILLPLAASTLSVAMLAAIAYRMFDRRVAIIAGLLYATFPIQLEFAAILEPEPIAECFVLLGVLAYLYARRATYSGLWFATGVLMGSAYLAKEVAAFVGLAFFVHAVMQRQWRGALLIALGLVTVVIVEHAYYYFVWNDVLFRPHSTQLYELPKSDSFFLPKLELKYRLFRKYPEAMLVPDLRMGLHSLACIVWAGIALLWARRRGFSMLVLWAVIPWLYLNFGSWSLTHYAPLPKDPRYLEFIYPPLMLLSAVVLSRVFASRRAIAWPAGAVFATVLVGGVFSGLMIRGTIARANEMSVLREIARSAQDSGGQAIYTDERRWHRALEIFNASLLTDSSDEATIVLRKDALGLPSVQSLSSPPNKSQVPR